MKSWHPSLRWVVKSVASLGALLAAGAQALTAGAMPAADPGAATVTMPPAVIGFAESATIPGPVGPDEPSVEIDIKTFEPAAPEPGDLLVIEGTVTNVTDAPLVHVQALLRHNLNALSSRTELELVDTDPRLVWGSRPGHVFAEVATSIPAGRTETFRVEAQLETSCPQAVPGAAPCVQIQHPGVYVFGIDIREGNANVPGARVDAGTTLSLVPWLIDHAEQSIEIAMLWPVSGSPAIQPDGTLGEVDAGGFVGPAGWLNTLLDAPGNAPITWVVDPDVLDTVAAIGDSDDRLAGSAERWLAEFDSTSHQAETWLLPFAVPDIAAFDRPDQTRLAGTAARLSAIAAQDLPTGTRTVAWPVGTDLAAELAAYRAAGITTAVVPSDAVDASGQPWIDLPAGNGQVLGLVVDSSLSSTFIYSDDAIALRQRWLAATALAVLDAPDDEPAPVVVSPPLGWRPNPQVADRLIEIWTETPWVEPVALGEIATERTPGTLLEADTAAGAQNSPATDAAAELLARVAQYEALLAEPTDSDDFSAVTVRAASAGWRADPGTGQDFIAAADSEVRALLSQVFVQVAPTVTLSSNTGAFPVNVVNQLDVPVTVRLELESANPHRMSVGSVTAQRIEPGETEIVRVTAEAVANGKVRVALQLATVDGTPLGTATQTVVNATEYGVIGWFLIVGAALLFVAGLAVRTVRGKRRNGTPGQPDPHLPDHAPLEGASR